MADPEPTLSAVLVTYRSWAVCERAVASLRVAAALARVTVEVILVDHSEDPSEVERLRSLAPAHLVAQPNRGYAAGVNAGLARARGRTVLVANPDVELDGQAVRALLGALDAGFDVVGPQLHLASWLFPPADSQTPAELVGRAVASWSPALWRRRLRLELGRSRAVWESSEPVPVANLSGSVLAFRRELATRIGPWDEGYFLYFEETDWLGRARRQGLRLGQVPGARVAHAWGHAADPAATAPVFERSRRRFVAAHHPVAGRLALTVHPGPAPLSTPPWPAGCATPEGCWWLLSPTALGLPAAGWWGGGAAPREPLAALAAARPQPWSYVLTAADPAGRWRGSWSWRVGDA